MIVERMDDVEIEYQLIFGLDKQKHLLSFTLISMMLAAFVILLSNRKTVLQHICYLWMVLVTVGVVEEYQQLLLPNRSTEFLDAVANMLGVTIGLALPVLILYLIWNRNHNLIKLLTMYSVVLIPLMIGCCILMKLHL